MRVPLLNPLLTPLLGFFRPFSAILCFFGAISALNLLSLRFLTVIMLFSLDSHVTLPISDFIGVLRFLVLPRCLELCSIELRSRRSVLMFRALLYRSWNLVPTTSTLELCSIDLRFLLIFRIGAKLYDHFRLAIYRRALFHIWLQSKTLPKFDRDLWINSVKLGRPRTEPKSGFIWLYPGLNLANDTNDPNFVN